MDENSTPLDIHIRKFLNETPFSLAIWRGKEALILEKYLKTHEVLDVGCGFGEFAGIFFDKKVSTGLDICEKDLSLAKRRNIYKNLILGDATDMPFENDTFDKVISISVLEHIPKSKIAIKESYRVLKDNGEFIITIPTKNINRDLLIATLLRKFKLHKISDFYVDMYNKVFKHEVMKDPMDWKKDLENAGFTNITMENALNKRELRIFEFMLFFSVPSQILRVITGKRFIYNFKFRENIAIKIFQILSNNYHEDDNELYNILIRAEKNVSIKISD